MLSNKNTPKTEYQNLEKPAKDMAWELMGPLQKPRFPQKKSGLVKGLLSISISK